MVNPMQIMAMKGMLEKFQANHPRVPLFLQEASQCMGEGSIIEMSVTTAEGKKLCTNMKVAEQDLELLEQLKGMTK